MHVEWKARKNNFAVLLVPLVLLVFVAIYLCLLSKLSEPHIVIFSANCISFTPQYSHLLLIKVTETFHVA